VRVGDDRAHADVNNVVVASDVFLIFVIIMYRLLSEDGDDGRQTWPEPEQRLETSQGKLCGKNV